VQNPKRNIKQQTTYPVHITVDELAIVVSLLRLPGIEGVPNPLDGLSADQLRERILEARQALLDEGYLEAQGDDTVVLDSTMATLVWAAATAPCAMIISYARDQQTNTRYIYLAEGFIVEQEMLEDSCISLTAVRDRDVLQERLFQYLALPACEAASTPEITLAEEVLAEAQRLALEPELCTGLLCQSGISEGAAEELAAALTAGKHVGSVAVMRRETGEGEQGYQIVPDSTVAWLVSPSGSWRVLPSRGDVSRSVRLIPSSREGIEQALTELISSVT